MCRWFALTVVVLCAACDARIGSGNGNAIDTSVDASTSSPVDGSTGSVDAPITPPPDGPACFNGRVVFLNFDGVTLTDAATSDATLNRASWMTQATGTAPPYKAGVANRATLIQQIVTGIRAQLSSFPVTVVTTRPATGPYVMIVFGGTGAQVGSRFGIAVNELDCGDLRKSDVAWIGDQLTAPQSVINTAIGAIGFGLGLTATQGATTCMCGWDNDCSSDNSVACTLSASIVRDPAARQLCPGLTTQNELATFTTAFCQ